MNLVDIAIVVIMTVSLAAGLFRGFIREVLSLASWILALWAAYHYARAGGTFLEPYIPEGFLTPYIAESSLGVAVAFVVIFVVVVIAASFVSYLLWRVLPMGSISGVDRSLGTLFGAGRGAIIVALLLLLVGTFTDLLPLPWREESRLAYFFTPVMDGLRVLMPGLADYFSKGGPV